jgi:hypothetical protein
MFLNPLKSEVPNPFFFRLQKSVLKRICVVSCLEAVCQQILYLILLVEVALSLAAVSAFLCEGLTSRFSTTPVP